jgi:hypothetical protein
MHLALQAHNIILIQRQIIVTGDTGILIKVKYRPMGPRGLWEVKDPIFPDIGT